MIEKRFQKVPSTNLAVSILWFTMCHGADFSPTEAHATRAQ